MKGLFVPAGRRRAPRGWALGVHPDRSAEQACLQWGVQAPREEVVLHSCSFCSQTSPCLESALTEQWSGLADVLRKSKADPRRSSSPCTGPAWRARTAVHHPSQPHVQGGRLRLATGLMLWEDNQKMSTPCKGSPFPCRRRSRSHKPEVPGQGDGRRPAAPGQERDAIPLPSFPELRSTANKGKQITKAIPASHSLGRWPGSARGQHELCFLAE